MNRKQLMEMFNKQPRIGALSTANKAGDVNAAVFGSPQMTDEDTVVMGIGNNRTLENLIDNPKAVFIFMEPGDNPAQWKGARVYLEAMAIYNKGDLFDQLKETIARVAGEHSAKMLHAVIRFNIIGVRPLIDPITRSS
jgi:hypothetical protein